MRRYFLFLSYFFTFLLFFYFVSVDSLKLGFFADDISIFYDLRNSSFTGLFLKLETFDSLRYFQIFNNYLFLKVSNIHNIDFIHIIQILLYFINSIILILILKKFEVRNTIVILAWVFSLFFGLNYEVLFWAHNLSMTLVASTSFLVFFYVNICLKKKFDFKKNILNEILIFFLAIYSILTYEQYIFGIYFIIFTRFLLIYLSNHKLYAYLLICFYSFIIFFIIYLKIFFMTELDLNINRDLKTIFENFLISIFTPFKFILSPINKEDIILDNIIIFLISCLFLFYILKVNYLKDNLRKKNANYSLFKLLFFFLFLYISLFLPLYFHFISPRHFYLPIFAIIIIFSLICDKIYKSFQNKKILLSVLLIIYSILLINNVLKINFHKYQQIENFTMKKDFYFNLLKLYPQVTEINLVNFPEKYKKNIMFAHEQGSVMKFLFDEKSPNIKIGNYKNNHGLKLFFIEILDNKIVYRTIK